MFAGARVFNQPLNHLETGGVRDFGEMLRDTPAFNQPLALDVGGAAAAADGDAGVWRNASD